MEIHIRPHKAHVGIFGRSDDRFAADIEGSINDDRVALLFFKALNHAVEERVPIFRDRLNTGGIIDVRDGRDS